MAKGLIKINKNMSNVSGTTAAIEVQVSADKKKVQTQPSFQERRQKRRVRAFSFQVGKSRTEEKTGEMSGV